MINTASHNVRILRKLPVIFIIVTTLFSFFVLFVSCVSRGPTLPNISPSFNIDLVNAYVNGTFICNLKKEDIKILFKSPSIMKNEDTIDIPGIGIGNPIYYHHMGLLIVMDKEPKDSLWFLKMHLSSTYDKNNSKIYSLFGGQISNEINGLWKSYQIVTQFEEYHPDIETAEYKKRTWELLGTPSYLLTNFSDIITVRFKTHEIRFMHNSETKFLDSIIIDCKIK